MGEELHRACDPFLPCLRDVHPVTAVVFCGRTEVPPLDSMWSPCSPVRGSLVDQDLGSGRCQWGAVEIKSSVELRFRRQTRIDGRWAEKVQGEEGLWEEAIPQVKGKVGIGACKGGDEVVLEGANGFLCRVVAVVTCSDCPSLPSIFSPFFWSTNVMETKSALANWGWL